MAARYTAAGHPSVRSTNSAIRPWGKVNTGGIQQLPRLGVTQRKLGHPQLDKPTVRAPPRERKRGLDSGRQRELAASREPLREVFDDGLRSSVGYQVKIVEHQDEIAVAAGARVHERRQHELLERRLGHRERLRDFIVEAYDRIERAEHGTEQRHRVVVAGVK